MYVVFALQRLSPLASSMAKYEWLYRAKFSAEDVLAKHTRISAGFASEQLCLGCM